MKYLNVAMRNFKIIFTLSAYLMLHNIVTADTVECELSNELKEEIASYQPIVTDIINKIVDGEYKGKTYDDLVNFIDKFGSRPAGSINLENAIDFMLEKSNEVNLENVHGEEVKIPHWVRGNESATLISPILRPMAMVGLGDSIGTSPEGIRAEAVVFNSFDELKEMADKVEGKIVVFNQEFTSYQETAKYRMFGASIASGYGAIATLIRSVTPFSLNTPHTGLQVYLNNDTRIPAACITMEDAKMLRRMQEKGEKLIIELKMEAQNLEPVISRNLVSEIVGSDQPEKVVVISGHIDTWDIARGAMDDGGGCMVTWNALVILKALGLKPKRTIRAILWTAEEIGIIGSFAYAKAHRAEAENFNFVMETDGGTFNPLGLQYTGLPKVGCILQEILNLLSAINMTQLTGPADFGPDLSTWLRIGIPGANLYSEISRYFWYHHTAADTVEVENTTTLDKATALWASVAYVIADLSIDFPKNIRNTAILKRSRLHYTELMN